MTTAQERPLELQVNGRNIIKCVFRRSMLIKRDDLMEMVMNKHENPSVFLKNMQTCGPNRSSGCCLTWQICQSSHD